MTPRRKLQACIGVGGAVILLAAAFFFTDVVARNGAVAPLEPLPPPEGRAAALGRVVAANITPIFWTGWLIVLVGVRGLLAGRLERPLRLAVCFVSSVGIWLVFDGYNFGFMHAWDYHGLAADPLHRYLTFFLAFGAICPAMFLTADILLAGGLGSVRGPRFAVGRKGRRALMIAGLLCALFPIMVASPVGSLTLWLAFLLILDPVNRRLGAPSVLGDLEAGRWGRPLTLMAGGLVCGFLWELWNFWATAKWTYDLPFLGPLEHVRYFEMPVVGMLGYLPFALECWAMFQTVAELLRRLGPVRPEPLPERACV